MVQFIHTNRLGKLYFKDGAGEEEVLRTIIRDDVRRDRREGLESFPVECRTLENILYLRGKV